jgi:hypothetical protein
MPYKDHSAQLQAGKDYKQTHAQIIVIQKCRNRRRSGSARTLPCPAGLVACGVQCNMECLSSRGDTANAGLAKATARVQELTGLRAALDHKTAKKVSKRAPTNCSMEKIETVLRDVHTHPASTVREITTRLRPTYNNNQALTMRYVLRMVNWLEEHGFVVVRLPSAKYLAPDDIIVAPAAPTTR